MSNADRNQLGIQPEVLRNIDKHGTLPTHDLHIGQHVMYQDSVTKQCHPSIITSLCQEEQIYNIKAGHGVFYWKIQAHLKPYTPQNKNAQSPQPLTKPMAQLEHKLPKVQLMAQPHHKKPLPVNKPPQVTTSRPKRDIKAPFKLHL